MDLAFFNQGGGAEKTEQATPKKREKSREEGQVAQSQEIGTAVLFIAIFTAARVFMPMMLGRIMGLMHGSFMSVPLAVEMMNIEVMSRMVWTMFGEIILIILPIALVAIGVGLMVNLAQVGWHPTGKPLRPKFSKLNPISGAKRVFSAKMLLELVKALLKFGVILAAVYFVIISQIDVIGMLMHWELSASIIFIASLLADIGLTVGVIYIFIAALDYFFNRRKHEKDLRMTKQEVKEEYKQMEGDPLIKGKIRQKMREVSARRMMQEVGGADVVITNPTHFAIALKYDRLKGGAPKCVAKGADFMAKRIKDMAKEHDVAIVEDKPLARALYQTVEVNEEIPPQLYQAVAEVLAYVYKLKNLLPAG